NSALHFETEFASGGGSARRVRQLKAESSADATLQIAFDDRPNGSYWPVGAGRQVTQTGRSILPKADAIVRT
ncbi:MAG TPA: hypothetical protein VF865_18455, partial [Acidobacteriaceae bacterium]